MLDAFLVKRLRTPLAKTAALLAGRGITANQLTLAGFVFGILAAICVALNLLWLALFGLLLNRLLDGLDGAVARQSKPTEAGAYLDIVLDFLFYALFPFAFALRDPSDAVAAAFLLVSFVGTGSSFLAFSIFAKTHGLTNTRLQEKSIYYLEGLTEGFETIMVFVLMCLFPQWFSVLAYLFGGLCLLTTVSRIWTATRALRGISGPDPDSLSESK